MKQHPVPQQISSYQFRLVGDMTLKQFFQLAAGILIAVLIYSTGLHPIIKFPLIIISIAGGAATAFLPYKERPITIWIYSFFRSIYAPTEFVWSPKTSYNFFAASTADTATPNNLAPQIKEETAPQSHKNLEGKEKDFLKKVNLLLKGDEEEYKKLTQQNQKPQESAQDILNKVSGISNPSLENNQNPQSQNQSVTINPQTINTNANLSQNNSANIYQAQIPNQTQNQTTPAQAPAQQPPVQPAFRPVVQAQNTDTPPDFSNNQNLQNVSQNQTTPVTQNIQPSYSSFINDTPPPIPPERANTINGQVLDQSGKPVIGAILEVTDDSGSPMRAVRTNKNGHFSVVTPLHNGVYNLVTEKEGFVFSPLKFEVLGDIVPPIIVKANS